MTEQVVGNGLGWLRHNVDVNRAQGKQLARLEALACDWTHYIRLGKGRIGDKTKDENHEQGVEGIAGIAQRLLQDPSVAHIDVSLANETWDVIIGSDLVYCDSGVTMLPRVMRVLCNERTKILYAHTKKRYEMVDIDFFAELRRYGTNEASVDLISIGFTIEELREPGIISPPESPLPMTDCFPPQRIAVFYIHL